MTATTSNRPLGPTLFALALALVVSLPPLVSAAPSSRLVRHAAPATDTSTPAPPLKGLVLWPGQARDRPDLSAAISLEFAYVLPCDLVRGLDPSGAPRYDWSPLDRLLDDIASRGHQAILRFRYEYPGEPLGGVRGATAVPTCVKALPGYRETFSPNPNGDGPTFYADWAHPALRAFTLRFFADFAARYDADPRLAYLEVGFGHWSEYHTFGTPLRPGVNFPSPDFQAAFLHRLAALFKCTPWLLSIDAADPDHSPLASDPTLLALSFGLFDDSFMHRRHDLAQGEGYNEKCWRALGADRWQRAPCGGEISYYSPKDQRDFLSPRGLYGVTFPAAAAKYHITFMIANDAPEGPHGTPAAFRVAADATGWRFRLDSFQIDSPTLRLRIANAGVAPLCHDAYPALGDSVSPDTLRGLLPNQTRTFTLPLPDPAPAPGAIPSLIRLTSPKLLPGATLPLDLP